MSSVQDIGVQFYDGFPYFVVRWFCLANQIFLEDINDRMPRAEAEAIFHHIKPLGEHHFTVFSVFSLSYLMNIALAIDPKLFIEIMGSFRRYMSPVVSLQHGYL